MTRALEGAFPSGGDYPGVFEYVNPTDQDTLRLAQLGSSRVYLETLGSKPVMPAGFIQAPISGKDLHPPQTALMSSGLRSLIGQGGPEGWETIFTSVEPQWGAINDLAISVEVNGQFLSYTASQTVIAQLEQAGLQGAVAPLAPGICP